MAEALKVNTTLTKLDLMYNQIGNQGAQALVEALKVNTTLIELTLWENRINDRNIIPIINGRLKINIVNKQRLRCLQILCLEKLKQLDRINDIQSFNPIVYDSCLGKY